MSDDLDPQDEFFQQLRREYLAEAPARLDELRKDLAAAAAREPEALASLRSRFHKLAGSGGSYGFPAITEASRLGEHWLLDNPEPRDDGFAWLGAVVGRIATAFEDAARELGIGSTSLSPDAFGWRAHVAGGTADLVFRISDALTQAQFSVSSGPLEPEPDIPVTERPDLVVLIPGADQQDLPALESWLRNSSHHSLGMALVTERPPAELLEGRFAAVDLLVSADRAEVELARWARTVARAASTPFSALLILAEEAERLAVAAWLEAAGVLVTTVESAEAGLGRMREEIPDFLVLDWQLPRQSATALVRMVRAASQSALVPVLGLTTPDDDQTHAEMIAAGVDVVIPRPLSPERLLTEAIHRARRTRRLEALLRRDALTGFLTRSALEDELEAVLAHARRSGEQVAFVVLDPDHFRRVNEQLGRQIGDQILLHIAQAIRRRVRASDFAARIGGEEFGILLRQCGPTEALVIANQLRTALMDRPPLVEGVAFPIRLSAGIASSEVSHPSARDLLWEAEQALREAKETGRDKVVVRG
jgi:diguanylate cyclase (GGDEF)-like protein